VKFAISELTFSPPLTAPVTYDAWMQTTQSLGGCIAVRNIQWLYSLVSMQGDRSICVYGVPYDDVLREAYRKARMSFQQIWSVELWLEQNPTSFPQGVSLVVAEVSFDPPMTKTHYDETKHQAVGCLQELNIQPLVSLISLDGKNAICLFVAVSAEDVRSLYRKINKPFKQVWKAILIQPFHAP
jgi:hypothetical protein